MRKKRTVKATTALNALAHMSDEDFAAVPLAVKVRICLDAADEVRSPHFPSPETEDKQA